MDLKPIISPIRYIGSKRRLVPTLSKYMPEGTKEILSPFCGAASFELALGQTGIQVHAHDNFELLIELWNAIQYKREELISIVTRHFLPLPSTTYYWAKKEVLKLDPSIFRAAMFYAINRASFCGATLDGGMVPDHPNLNTSILATLSNFKLDNITFRLADFEDSMSSHGDILTYLDPPYFGVAIDYGGVKSVGSGFDHAKLHSILMERENWILSYDNNPTILQLYAGQRVVFPGVEYMTNSVAGKGSREVIILGDGIDV